MKSKAIHLLLVEDDKVDQMAFERFVKRENLPYEHVIAGSVAEATTVLKSTSFDVIISDYMLGDGTSFELFDSYRDTPVIMTTGSGDEEVAVSAMKLGFSDYLIKDPEGNYLKTLPITVELALKRKQNETELQNYHERLESMVEERTSELRAEIAERKKVGEALKESEEGFRAIFNASNDAIFIHDLETGAILNVNQKACKVFGLSPEEIIKTDVGTLSSGVPPYSQEEAIGWMKKAAAGKPQLFEWCAKDKTGQFIWFEVNMRRAAIGPVDRIIVTARDINERKQAEEAILKSAARYRGLSEASFEAIFISEKGVCLEQNSTAEKIFGYTLSEAIGRKATEWIVPEDRELVTKNMLSGYEAPYEVTALRKDGSTFPALIQGKTMHYEEKSVRITALTDITDRKQAEEQSRELEVQLRQKYKMEAVGLMAGGMAHNFNNNLAIILGNVELAQLKIPADSDVIDYLKNAKIAVLRSRDLIQQIMTFSRKEKKGVIPIQPALVVDETLKMLSSTIPSTVNLRQVISTHSRDIAIQADPSQIQEILLNLCTNAVHAMEEKGALTVSLETVLLQRQDIPSQYECLPGCYAKISVQDDGSGITEEIQKKIFDPFFTTKEVGQGTGMGLSTVYGIVMQYKGIIKVKSIVGQGTTFELYFPVVESQQLEIPAIVPDLPRGNEKILFLDDDEMLMNVWSQMLTEYGYQVSTMTSSTETLKLFKANPDYFDLLITDQTMPDMTGQELIREILNIRPQLPTILCTGYSTKIDKEEAEEQGIKAFCEKPLDLAELLVTTRRVLDENR